MAVDAMEIDSNAASMVPFESEKERKRKHKHKDEGSSSKKKRKHEKVDDDDKKSSKKKDKSSKGKDKSKGKSKTTTTPQAQQDTATAPDSPYSLTTATLYLPLSPISISPTHALASLLAEHLSPLLLTYYPPLHGIILAYSNASISSEPPSASSTLSPSPEPLTLATTAGEYGVMYVYLTATFLVFRPQRGQLLEGWINVQSEGFLGAVVLNLFSVGIERKRLPPTWKWIPPGEDDDNSSATQAISAKPSSDEDEDEEKSTSLLSAFDPEKEHFNPVTLASDANPFFYDSQDQYPTTATTNAGGGEEEEAQAEAEDYDESLEGYFQSVSGHRVRGTVKFRVVDVDVIPGSERDRGFLSIEGTMLSPEEEGRVLEDERNGVMAPLSTVRTATIPVSAMSGGIVPPENDVVDIEIDTPSKKSTKGKAKSKR